MAGTAALTYSLKFQSRALAAVNSDKLVSTWIVGTNALREENEVRIMQYDPDQERLLCSKSLTHGPEIWDISACPTPLDLILTVWSEGGNYGATLWSTAGGQAVQKVTDLQGHTGQIRKAQWHPSQPELALTVEEGAIHTWAVGQEGASCTGNAQAGELLQLWSGTLQPLNTHTAATAGGNNVQLWDLRSMAVSAEVVGAHRMPVRDVCFSSSNEHRLISGGDDCKIRLWDLRMIGKSSEALLELGGHSHWAWRAQCCPFYDQLIASSSSDSMVNLYYTPQLAGQSESGSDVPKTAIPTREQGRAGGDLDGKVRTYDEHEDSVYGLAWSAADPWLFASLSYDGRVVVNKVPKNIKYKIIV